MKSIIGVFPDRKDAEKVYDNLLESGYKSSEISVVVKENAAFSNRESRGKKGGMSTSDITKGIVTGGIVGTLAGILVGIGSIAVPGLGALIITGPIAAALGLTGAAASTISGATTGALAGGLTGGLVEIGLNDKDAQYYEESIKNGAVLISVPASNDKLADHIEGMFKQNGAERISKSNEI